MILLPVPRYYTREIRKGFFSKKKNKNKLEFVFLQKHRCLPSFWCHIVLYIQRTFILTDEIPRKITQNVSMQELWFLHFASCLMLIDIHKKFLEVILNDFQVIVQTHFL